MGEKQDESPRPLGIPRPSLRSSFLWCLPDRGTTETASPFLSSPEYRLDPDALLFDLEAALTKLDFSVDILEQDGSEQPDGTETHPKYDIEFALEAVYYEYIAERESSSQSNQQTLDAAHAPDTGVSADTQQPTLEDEELLERARSASNGAKFDRLWRGSTTGYDS